MDGPLESYQSGALVNSTAAYLNVHPGAHKSFFHVILHRSRVTTEENVLKILIKQILGAGAIEQCVGCLPCPQLSWV